mmetsp:Transcript_99820/g.310936  ORF Transcript_99820/g.310936 Transcript_99820/m.310936 type:complete len:427 (-) Transcript_99820:313-1593(-)
MPASSKAVTCVGRLVQAAFFGLLLTSNVAQRVTFKFLGYTLGPYPYFVLLSISGVFVPIFALICIAIVVTTGGFLAETRTWHCLGVNAVIGCFNALQGAGMVFANPHVPGHLQALLQQGVIPFTFATSLLTIGAHFSWQQYLGVLLIVVGVCVQLGPDLLAAGAEDAAQAPGAWASLFLLAQLPVALSAVLQERAFSKRPVNVFYMMFWASLAQFGTLLLLAPLGISPSAPGQAGWEAVLAYMQEAVSVVQHDGGAAETLSGCMLTMLLAQLAQAYMVKLSSAAFTVLCLALVMPASALAFSTQMVMGPHVERLGLGSVAALVLVFVGISMYQLDGGSAEGEAPDKPRGAPGPGPREGRLAAALLERRPTGGPRDGQRPIVRLCSGGVGVISSGYTNAEGAPCALWEEQTLVAARSRSRLGGLADA